MLNRLGASPQTPGKKLSDRQLSFSVTGLPEKELSLGNYGLGYDCVRKKLSDRQLSFEEAAVALKKTPSDTYRRDLLNNY